MECAELAEAGVVDEDVDFKACAFRGVVNFLRGGGIVEVGGDGANLSSLAGEFGGQSVEAILAARRENQFCAAGRQLPRQLRTDACAGACNQRPFAVEVGCVCHCGLIITDGRGNEVRQDSGMRATS